MFKYSTHSSNYVNKLDENSAIIYSKFISDGNFTNELLKSIYDDTKLVVYIYERLQTFY